MIILSMSGDDGVNLQALCQFQHGIFVGDADVVLLVDQSMHRVFGHIVAGDDVMALL